MTVRDDTIVIIFIMLLTSVINVRVTLTYLYKFTVTQSAGFVTKILKYFPRIHVI